MQVAEASKSNAKLSNSTSFKIYKTNEQDNLGKSNTSIF